MDDNQKEALRRSRVFLVTNLIPESLWDHLISNNIFTDMMLEYIKCKKPRSEQVRSLLSDLNRRHRGAYDAFLKCLMETGHEHCAQEIKNNMTKILIEKGQSPVVEETSSPNHNSEPAIGRFVESSRSHVATPAEDVEMGMAEHAEMDRSSSSASFGSTQESSPNYYSRSIPESMDYWFHKARSPDDIYKMESSPRGFLYMINNINFTTMGNRLGSDVDEARLKELFEDLGFYIHVDRDLTASDMKTRLESLAKYELMGRVDSCVIVILSHGGNQCMYGIDATGRPDDSSYITDVDLKYWFGNQNCQLLQGKPKLFLIQACRGRRKCILVPQGRLIFNRFETSTGSEDGGAPSMSTRTLSSTISTSTVSTDVNKELSSVGDCEMPGQQAIPSLPNPTDMIIAHSSCEGFVSYRSPEEGSIFIGEVVNIFRKHASDHHVMDLLTKVNRCVATNFTSPDAKKMMPSPTNLLLKFWYLNPQNNPTV